MNIDSILSALKAERYRLDQAIAALEGASGPRRGRPPLSATGRRRRHMSAAARRRISQAMKARWAVRKKTKSA